MRSPIEKEKAQKKQNKTTLIIAGICYFIGSLVYLHSTVLMRENKRLTMTEAIDMSFSRILSDPLAIFRLDGSTFLMYFLITVAFITLAVMFTAEKSLKKHDNPDTVNGEARLMTAADLAAYNLKFSSPIGKPENNGANNMIISKDIRLAIDNRGTRRNCNILVIGGSGAGKSRFFASPNILQYNCNFVITDPSGEMLRDYGKALENNGYAVKVFNLTDVYRSNRYNPFHYIQEEKDVFTLVNTLIKNTNPSDGKGGDPFWENSEKLLITALILYLWHTAPPEKQNFTSVVKLISMAEVDENDATAESPLDMLFKDLENEDPENLAIKQYKKFKLGAGKTLKSILISVGVRLQSFDLQDIQYLTSDDDFEFENFSDTKQALFVIIPTADTTFNFLVSLLYSQLFASLYTYAETTASFGWKASIDPLTNIKVVHAKNEKDSKRAEKELRDYVAKVKKGVKVKLDKNKNVYYIYTKDGKDIVGWRGNKEQVKKFIEQLKNIKIEKCGARCPNHVRLILDEFANIGQIPDFDQKLATMRKYEISCSIILQALSQLKDIYKDKWNTLVGNCDTKLFLGSDDTETIEWMVKILGKKTTVVENTSWQGKGQGSTSYNRSSIELLTIDQISLMQDNECIVRIRGVHPYWGKKFELTDHPNYPEAKATEGTFVVPLAPGAENRSSGPLRLKRLQALAAADKQSEKKKVNPIADIDSKRNTSASNPSEYEFSEEEKRRMDVGNETRKQLSQKAQADLESVQNDPDISNEIILDDILSSMGIDVNSTEEQIKEACESILLLQDFENEQLNFMAT